MKYWNDDYLQKLQESEPFGGIKLRENSDNINDIISGFIPIFNKYKIKFKASDALLVVAEKTNEVRKAFIIDGDPRHIRSFTEPVTAVSTRINPPSFKDFKNEKDTSFNVYLYMDQNESHDYRKQLEKNGWKLGKPMNSNDWDNLDAELKSGKKSDKESQVVQHTSDALKAGAQREVSWVGSPTGTK